MVKQFLEEVLEFNLLLKIIVDFFSLYFGKKYVLLVLFTVTDENSDSESEVEDRLKGKGRFTNTVPYKSIPSEKGMNTYARHYTVCHILFMQPSLTGFYLCVLQQFDPFEGS